MSLRIGILGAGRVATYGMIAPARTVEGVEVVAVAARDAARAEAFAAIHGIARGVGSYTSLITDPGVDLVYIATPPSTHVEQALAVLAAGKPVLVEKPFALKAADAVRVHAAAKNAGVRVFEAMHSLHHALFARVLEIIASGEIGQVREIDALFEAPIDPADPVRWSSELGGGALMDLGVYPLAWVRRIAGECFEVVRSTASFRNGVDASFEAQLRFGNGPTCLVSASMVANTAIARLLVKGSAGELRVRNPVLPQLGNKLSIVTAAGDQSEQIEGPTSYEAQLAAVRDTVVSGAAFPLPADDFIASTVAIEKVRSSLSK